MSKGLRYTKRQYLSCLALSVLSFSVDASNRNTQAELSIYPKGQINEKSNPQISWNCTSDTSARFTLTENRTGKIIQDIPWTFIASMGAPGRCSLNGYNVAGKKIVPPLRPFKCDKPGCIRYVTPTHGGLLPGDYTLTLALKTNQDSPNIYTSNFSIIHNIYSSFSSDEANWRAIYGEWNSNFGRYSIKGNSRGEPWVSVYDGQVVSNRKGSAFIDGRYFEIRMSPNCSSERCYAGIVTAMARLGETNGVVRYARSEVVITGDYKLYVRTSTDDEPGFYWVALNGLDVSKFISGKSSYKLGVYISSPGNYGSFNVFIDGDFVYCGNNSVSNYGRAGIVFSSHEDFESLDVDEFSVSPTPVLFHTCYWRLPYIPPK
ncbi:hypothetical protein [Pseudomonas sp. KCJK9044]|uniref:hypothetical protein n=1 Tax=Pseudomonas sp. KCJK9044 TaxID=3344562 RepID=UPI00390596F8